MISLRIVVGGRVIGLYGVPPEIVLDDVVEALSRGADGYDGDLEWISSLQSAMDVPDEWRDDVWRGGLMYIRHCAERASMPEITPGDLIEVHHDEQLVICHWLVAFEADGPVWASLPNERYRPKMVARGGVR